MTLVRRRGDRHGAFSGTHPERAIVDIGSNTVRLVIYGGSRRAPAVLLNEKVTARLGRDITKNGTLANDAVALAMRGLERFALLLRDLQIDDVEVVATAAVREATNASHFVSTLEGLGLSPKVLSGEAEARLSANGVAGAFPSASGTVADLGGGSLELVSIDEGQSGECVSLPLGTLRLPDYHDKTSGAMRKVLEHTIAQGTIADGKQNIVAPAAGRPLYLVGGTWRCMAVYAMQERAHPLTDPHGFAMTFDEAGALTKALAKEDIDALKNRSRISSMRAEKLPDAAVLLQALLAQLEPSELRFSSWGLREGLLFDRLSAYDRMQDPLLAGIAVFAAQRGAPATLATRVAGWTVEAAPARRHGSERLRLTATMLALAAMQIEPNIRLPQAIDWALHKRWIALEPKERALLAAAIAANGNSLDLPDKVTKLASEEALEEAICWGLAVRLARRLGGGSARSFEASRLRVRDGQLILRLAESHAALFGLPTEKDMKLLASRRGMDWTVETVPDDALDAR